MFKTLLSKIRTPKHRPYWTDEILVDRKLYTGFHLIIEGPIDPERIETAIYSVVDWDGSVVAFASCTGTLDEVHRWVDA